MGLSGVDVPPSVLEPGRGVPVGWGHCKISPFPSARLCLGLQGSLRRPWWGLAGVCWHWVLSWPFSEGSFKQPPVPKVILDLGPPGFLFKATRAQLCCMSPSPSEPPRRTCSNWSCPKESFLLVWDPQQLKHLQRGPRIRGEIMTGCLHCCLQALDVEQCGSGAVSMLPAGRDFPRH